IVQLGYVLNSLLDVAVEARIALLEEAYVVLVDHAHVDILEEQHVIEVLQAAHPEHRQDAQAIRAQVVEHVAHVLGEPRAGAREARHDDVDGDVVRLALLVLPGGIGAFGVGEAERGTEEEERAKGCKKQSKRSLKAGAGDTHYLPPETGGDDDLRS